jgi:ATP-dependent Clp protease adaptor protein ClpS
MIEGFGLRQSCTTTVRLANADRQRLSDNQFVNTIVVPAEVEVREPASEEDVEHDRPWVVIVWNDPINLMSYVSLAKATKLMLQVHNEGKAVVSSGNREKSELDVSRLHAHGLWATMQQD